MTTDGQWIPALVPITILKLRVEGLGLHVVYITHHVITITKHLHNQIEIIEIESNRKEYLKSNLWSIIKNINRQTDPYGKAHVSPVYSPP